MATRIEALRDFGPRLKHNKTLDDRDLAQWVAMRTSMNPNVITLALLELKAAIIYHALQGTPLKLAGLFRVAPTIDRHGNIKLNLRVDADLKDTINNIKHYTGEIQNRANIGMTDEEMKALWDAVHADDPLELE